jgi:hypothetical protein
LYVPRRFFKPLPNANIGVINNSFVVSALRGESKYYYSQVGDKYYCMGYYKSPTQRKSITGSISHMVTFPSKVIIFTYKKTGVLTLSSSSNVGRTTVGENIFELPAMTTIDTERGVRAWQTIKFKNAGVLYALCNDSSYRAFDGYSWGKDDLAIVGGKDAVSKKYLKVADQSNEINAFYSNNDGMKIWFQKLGEKYVSSQSNYKVVQYTLDSSDARIQMVLDPKEISGSSLNDVEMIMLKKV